MQENCKDPYRKQNAIKNDKNSGIKFLNPNMKV